MPASQAQSSLDLWLHLDSRLVLTGTQFPTLSMVGSVGKAAVNNML